MHLRVVKSNDVVYIDIHGFHTRFYWNSINDNHDKQLDLVTLQWRQRNGVSNHRLFAQPFVQADQRKKSKLRVTGLCEGNLPTTVGFPPRRVSNAENVSIWWRHHDYSAVKITCIDPTTIRAISIDLLSQYNDSHYKDKTVVRPVLVRRHLDIETSREEQI